MVERNKMAGNVTREADSFFGVLKTKRIETEGKNCGFCEKGR